MKHIKSAHANHAKHFSALIILVFALIFCLTACSTQRDIGMVDDLTEEFLNRFFADDFDGAYALIQATASPEEFQNAWDALHIASEGATSYKLEQIGWNITTQNGTTSRAAAFEVHLNNGRTLFLRTTLIEGIDGIGGIYFHDTTEFNATSVDFAHITNIVLIVCSVIVIAFTIWMLIDCVRRKIAKKAMWIIVILLGFTLTLTLGRQLGIHFGIGVFLMLSSATADPSILSVTAKLIIPIGALIYFFLRKRLTITAKPEEGTENSEATVEKEDTQE